MKKHFCDIKNELAYFKTVVKNVDLDDIKNEKKHTDNDIHYEEFLDENSIDIFQIMTESKYTGSMRWIDLIQNEKLHRAIEKLTEEEKYLITLLFYEDRTQEELFKNLKYKEEKSTAFIGDKEYTVINLPPIYTKEERQKIKEEIESRLFEVFRKDV